MDPNQVAVVVSLDAYFWAVSVIGAGALVGVFVTKKTGFGPFNLRAVGLVLVATFVALLSLKDSCGVSSATGILGAIAGY